MGFGEEISAEAEDQGFAALPPPCPERRPPPRDFCSPAGAETTPPPGLMKPYVWGGGQHIVSPIQLPALYPYGGVPPCPFKPNPPPLEAGEATSLPFSEKKAKAAMEDVVLDSGRCKYREKSSSSSEDEDAAPSDDEASSEERDAEGGQPKDFSIVAHMSSEAYRAIGMTSSKLPILAPRRTVIPGPPSTSNVGMDLGNASQTEASVMKGGFTAGTHAPVLQKLAIPPIQWVQDEREIKRQKRKQSNRESARRSRLRKQQECEDLEKKVHELSSENSALRSEIEQLKKNCKDLEAENASILVLLGQSSSSAR